MYIQMIVNVSFVIINMNVVAMTHMTMKLKMKNRI